MLTIISMACCRFHVFIGEVISLWSCRETCCLSAHLSVLELVSTFSSDEEDRTQGVHRWGEKKVHYCIMLSKRQRRKASSALAMPNQKAKPTEQK